MNARDGFRVRKREGPIWLAVFVGSVIACLAIYAVNLLVSEASASNVWGLSYGSAAGVLLVGVLLLGIRRRSMSLSSKWRLGRARTWLYFHIYGGSLFMLLVLMHSEFRLPVGLVTWWLYWLSAATVVSGFAGLSLQKWVPKVLASGLSIEVNYDRIPDLVRDLAGRATELAGSAEESIQALHGKDVAPALEGPEWRLIYFVDITGGIRSRLNKFEYLGRFLESGERQKLAELEQIYRAKLEIDAHYTLQSVLRLWLYAHVPVSLLVLGFFVLHLFSVYYW